MTVIYSDLLTRSIYSTIALLAPQLTQKLLFASANALRITIKNYDRKLSFKQKHILAKRVNPDQISNPGSNVTTPKMEKIFKKMGKIFVSWTILSSRKISVKNLAIFLKHTSLLYEICNDPNNGKDCLVLNLNQNFNNRHQKLITLDKSRFKVVKTRLKTD